MEYWIYQSEGKLLFNIVIFLLSLVGQSQYSNFLADRSSRSLSRNILILHCIVLYYEDRILMILKCTVRIAKKKPYCQ